MKIVVVHPCQDFYGGAEEVVVRLDNWLHEKGYQYEIVLKSPPEQMLRDLRGKFHVANGYLEMMERVHALSSDAIVAYNFPASLTAFPFRTPMMWYVNEPPELFTEWYRKPLEALNRWWVKRSHVTTAVATVFDQARFQSIYGFKPSIIPYGIDFEWWSADIKEPMIVPDHSLNLLHVGTITPLKNQLWSLQVLRTLLHHVDASLTFIGAPSDKKYTRKLESFATEWCLDGRVFFLGQQTREYVRKAYNVYDVLLHPVKGQGGWLAPLEATCAGMPVITIPDFQESQLFNNVVSSPEDASVMLMDYDVTELFDAQLKYVIETELTWDRYCSQVVQQLGGLLSGKSNL